MRWWHRLRHNWRVWAELRRLRREHAMAVILEQAGAIHSRPLNQQDTVLCCDWVLAHCPRSSRGRIGQGNVRIAIATRTAAQGRIDRAFAEGLTPADDWALMSVRFLLEDPQERMLFKLTWC